VLVWELDTPALVVDLDIMEQNLRRAAEYAAAHDLRLRPHTKTHKAPELARRQIALGAAGLTVAKVGEAEVMLRAGPADLLLAYPVIGAAKLRRLVEVARFARVTVALDSLTTATELSDAARAATVSFGVLAEVDVGGGRVGVTPGAELRDLARGLASLPGLEFEGIAFYPGHIRHLDEAGVKALDALDRLVRSIVADLRRDGFEVPIVSGGSTPSLYHSHRVTAMNEIRPGTYIFNDRNTATCGACDANDCAAFVLATVVSTARPGQVIMDGGSKTFSSDRLAGAGDEAGYGLVIEDPRAVFVKMNEEHGFVDVRACDTHFRIGDRVRVIPNHICTAVNLHETMYGIRGEEVVAEWKVAGRGKLQ
jgi:D-serine deaminase-like pyridoxal phosphate-dependent protein